LSVVLVCASTALADDWLCKQESSQLVEKSLQACGIGEGKDENDARTKAFENARAEFLRVCSASDTCKHKEVSVEPKRTTCEKTKSGHRCYRLVVFTIGDANSKSKLDGALESDRPAIAIHDKKEVFKSFIYESIANLPKVVRGQSKAELLAEFGAPHSVVQVGSGSNVYYIFNYSGSMCLYGSCNVTFISGKVYSYEQFKPIYTEDLK
jgi:hypothetical protein